MSKDVQSKIVNLIKGTCINLNLNNSANKNEDKNSKITNLNDIVKLEIIYKWGTLKKDYKLTNNMRFEHFRDYFTSKLRTCDLLYIVDEKNNVNNIDESMLNERRFKVWDILINHLDSNYHAKVLQYQDPKLILY